MDIDWTDRLRNEMLQRVKEEREYPTESKRKVG